MSRPVPDRYLLPEDQAWAIFTQAIVPQLLTGASQARPVVVFVAGQPGAGKSRVQAALLGELGRGQALAIDADDMRPYHPRYEQLALVDDRVAANLVHLDAQRWVRMSIAHAIEQRNDVVMSTTFGHAASSESLINRFRDAGYRVEVAFVAVHDAHSRVGVLERYQHQREALGYGRYVAAAVQHEAYQGLLDTAGRIDESGLADAVYVYQRGGTRLYGRVRPDQPAGARAAIEQERARPWTPEETQRFVDSVRHLSEVLPADLHGELAAIAVHGLDHLQATADPDHGHDEAAVDAARLVAQSFPTQAGRPAPSPARPAPGQPVSPGRARDDVDRSR